MWKHAKAGVDDIGLGIRSWRTWSMLAWNDVRRRYRRSALGQFWLTLSMAVMIGGMGFVYSQLFEIDVSTYLPYIAVSFVVWGTISAIVVESCNALSEGEHLLRHMYLPKSVFACRIIARNLIVVAHNLIIIPIVFVVFGVGINANLLWLAVGVFLLIVNGFWIGIFLAIVCARFRDIPQIVASIMQVVFFVTPVMFLPQQLAARRITALRWNPFANMLELIRDPILGVMPSDWALISCGTTALVGFLLVVPFLGRFAARSIYWL
jgi:ABC-type polysaccharide/polyol phosphate export permease